MQHLLSRCAPSVGVGSDCCLCSCSNQPHSQRISRSKLSLLLSAPLPALPVPPPPVLLLVLLLLLSVLLSCFPGGGKPYSPRYWNFRTCLLQLLLVNIRGNSHTSSCKSAGLQPMADREDSTGAMSRSTCFVNNCQ